VLQDAEIQEPGAELRFLLLFLLFVFETKSLYEAQAGLELVILLPQPSKYWDYGSAPPAMA
jgi:hypothetical protein